MVWSVLTLLKVKQYFWEICRTWSKVRGSKLKVIRRSLFSFLFHYLIIKANGFNCQPKHRGCANQDSAFIDEQFKWDDVYEVDGKTGAEQCWERCKENEALGCTGFLSHFFGQCYLVKEDCQVLKPYYHRKDHLFFKFKLRKFTITKQLL